MSDERFMRMALRLARRGRPSPNPRVGAVIARDGEVLATGYHRAAGEPHAEAMALAKLDFRAPGATLYVTLEPCVHYGRTPPCAESIVSAGISEVVAGMVDPNPRVRGRGIERLREAGIRVRVGVLEQECTDLNRGFIKVMTLGLPHLTLKVAATADGKLATVAGASRWITSGEARRAVHRLRADSDAIIVGSGTVAADDPRLTARHGGRPRGRQPLRVVLDSTLRCPQDALVFTDRAAPTLVFTTPGADSRKRDELETRGVEVAEVPADIAGKVALPAVLRNLAGRGVLYALAEPGSTLAWSLARSGFVDRYWFFHAPKLFGGARAPTMMGGEGVARVEEAVPLRWSRIRRIGQDVLLEAVPMDREDGPDRDTGE